ncbi:MAG: metallophosphoesterase family protein [Lewinella sp.]|nr:metallophosphoesterase family protein [Lewinella sp.]
MRIGLLSDTHGWLDPKILDHFRVCDEVWHAGDIGEGDVLATLEAFKPLRVVFGNIETPEQQRALPEDLFFTAEEVPVFMTHIGGYPGRYNPRVRRLLDELQPRLYICGHSHILKVMPDRQRGLLHINPGACGQHGFHVMRTIVRFSLEAGEIKDLEVIELGRRGKLD